ncbi:MAG: hypothetical protein A2W26_03760 [Acidobacteria bacterium RBG_16_64_8]|nr:MAG: hypothetical protein A2W26_03760 [Acidobacteria bacterium RBG_16_64_8]
MLQMKGGSSGNREDYLAQVPSGGESQPIVTTEHGGASPTVHLVVGTSGNREGDTLPQMPTGGSNPIEGHPGTMGQQG